MPSAPRRSLPFSILAAGFDLYADDSALRECDESRGTRYSERHSAQKDAARQHRPYPRKVESERRAPGTGSRYQLIPTSPTSDAVD
jgi:hypothetical protein